MCVSLAITRLPPGRARDFSRADRAKLRTPLTTSLLAEPRPRRQRYQERATALPAARRGIHRAHTVRWTGAIRHKAAFSNAGETSAAASAPPSTPRRRPAWAAAARNHHQPPPQPLPLILPPRTSASERFRQRHHRPLSETKGSRKRARRRQVPRRTAEVLNTARRWQQCAEPLPTPGVTAAVRLGRLVVVAVGLSWNRVRVSAVDREPEPST